MPNHTLRKICETDDLSLKLIHPSNNVLIRRRGKNFLNNLTTKKTRQYTAKRFIDVYFGLILNHFQSYSNRPLFTFYLIQTKLIFYLNKIENCLRANRNVFQ